MNTKRILLLALALASATPLAIAQTNTFPTSGNVGVGTTSPNQKLEVFNGNFGISRRDGYNPSIILDSDAGNTGDIQFKDGGVLTTLLRLNSDSNGGTFDLQDRVGGAQSRLYIDGLGNVGIGTVSPAAVLDVSSPSQLSERIRISGQEFYTSTETSDEGVSFVLGVNRDSNRQLWIADSKRLARNATNPVLRLLIGGNTPRIDAIATDGNTVLNLGLQSNGGNVGIGTSSPTHKLSVNGTVRAKEVIVDTGWSDFVFDDGYELPSLTEVETHILAHGHLPDIPSAAEVESEGLSVGEAQKLMMQKIEELTLYMIELKKENDSLKTKVAEHDQKLLAR